MDGAYYRDNDTGAIRTEENWEIYWSELGDVTDTNGRFDRLVEVEQNDNGEWVEVSA